MRPLLVALDRLSSVSAVSRCVALALLGAGLLSCNEPQGRERASVDDRREALPEGVKPQTPVQGSDSAARRPGPAPGLESTGTPGAEQDPPRVDAPEADESGGPAAEESMRLLSPGSTPRSALRLLPAVGSTAKVQITNVPSVKVTVDGKLAPQQVAPGSEITMAFTVTEVKPEQSIHYTYEILDSAVAGTGLNPQLAAAANKSYALLEGLTGWARLTSRGQQQDAGVKFPDGIPEAARAGLQMMEQSVRPMVPPLPEAEVGVGAKWQHTQTVQQGPMRLQQISEYLLKSHAGGLLVLEMKIEQNASAQELPGPNGQSVKMGEMKGTGTGLVQMSLDSVVPRSARLQVTTVGEMSSQGQTAKIESTQTMTMKPVAAVGSGSKTQVVNASAK